MRPAGHNPGWSANRCDPVYAVFLAVADLAVAGFAGALAGEAFLAAAAEGAATGVFLGAAVALGTDFDGVLVALAVAVVVADFVAAEVEVVGFAVAVGLGRWVGVVLATTGFAAVPVGLAGAGDAVFFEAADVDAVDLETTGLAAVALVAGFVAAEEEGVGFAACVDGAGLELIVSSWLAMVASFWASCVSFSCTCSSRRAISARAFSSSALSVSSSLKCTHSSTTKWG